MFEITKIEIQKKDCERSSVFINGTFAFGVTNQAVKRYNLKEGMRLGDKEYEELLEVISLDKAKYKALDYISYTNRTEKQVRDKLIGLEYEESIVEKVLEFLKKYNYINDAQYVKGYLNDGVKYKNKSIKKLKSELYYKGVENLDFEVEEELENIELENIIRLLKKYRYKSDLEFKEKQKIIRKLLTRGFGYDLVKEGLYKIDESFEL